MTSENVKRVLQLLADEKVLSKTKPNTFRIDKQSSTIKVFYETENYRSEFLTIQLPKKRNPQERLNRNTPTVEEYQFAVPSDLYTPFLYPILGLDKKIQHVSPAFSYGVEIQKIETIIKRAKFLLEKGKVPANRLPQFLALSSSKILVNSPTYLGEGNTPVYATTLDIQGQARFTTIQIVKYLQQTDDVEEVIRLWITGVLPDEYPTYKESFALAPEEWIKDLFSENIKDYWPENIINPPTTGRFKRGRR